MSEKAEALMKWAKDAGSSPEDLVRFATLTIADRDAEIERLRGLLLDIRKDEQTSHWHRDIDAAVDASKEPATEPAIRARGEVPR